MLKLNPPSTGLVLIDIQQGILAIPMGPRQAPEIVANCSRLAKACKEAGATVIYVKVDFAADYADKPNRPTDVPMVLPPGGLPAGFASHHPDLLATAPDLVVTKRQWSAFFGTELDLQLRRRGIDTIVLGGLATNFGVESTARDAWQHNYAVVIAEDACSSFSAEMHDFSIRSVMPRIAHVSETGAISAALAAA